MLSLSRLALASNLRWRRETFWSCVASVFVKLELWAVGRMPPCLSSSTSAKSFVMTGFGGNLEPEVPAWPPLLIFLVKLMALLRSAIVMTFFSTCPGCPRSRQGIGWWRLFPWVCCCWWSWTLIAFVVRKILSDSRLKFDLGQLQWRKAVQSVVVKVRVLASFSVIYLSGCQVPSTKHQEDWPQVTDWKLAVLRMLSVYIASMQTYTAPRLNCPSR